MKSLMIAGLVVLVALLFWQQSTLHSLREEVAIASEGRGDSSSAGPPVPDEAGRILAPLSGEEAKTFIATLRTAAGKFVNFPGTSGEKFQAFAKTQTAIFDTVRRMSPEQVVAVFPEWTEDRPAPTEHDERVYVLMRLIEELNPGALVKGLAKIGQEKRFQSLYRCFSNWFRQDRTALGQWAKGQLGTKVELLDTSATPWTAERQFYQRVVLWKAATEIVANPSGPGVAEIANAIRAKRFDEFEFEKVLSILAVELQTNDARLKFLTALHEASEGHAPISLFVIELTRRTNFAQAAQLADQAPNFGPKSPTATPPRDNPRSDGSLRYTVAQWSMHGTPTERWNWLTQRETPDEGDFRALVKSWKENDRAGTEAWVQQLPPGKLRTIAESMIKKR